MVNFFEGAIMFLKKSHKEEEAFKNKLNSIIIDSEVQKNSKLVELLQNAVRKVDMHESIQSIASSLSLKLKSNFSENKLPASVVDLQLKLERYAAVGANGVVAGIFNW